MTSALDFGVLGPVRVRFAQIELPIRSARLSRLVAALSLDAGHVVTIDRLVDVVWCDEPPATARRQIQDLISRLRWQLTRAGCDDVPLTTTAAGYRLDGAVDMATFAEAVTAARSARATDPAAASDRLRTALSAWRGDALAGLDCPALLADKVRLDESRLAAWELCIDIDLDLGRHENLVGELAALVAAHPTRERFVALYMLAAYRTGRVSDAVEAFHRLRRRLADELGVVPGHEIRELNDAIVRGDERLLTPLATGPKQAVRAEGAIWTAPAQLPTDVVDFTGRAVELAQLRKLMEPGPTGNAVVISAIGGAGGVGKTALALRCAHDVIDEFPDGQLFADLRGWGPDTPAEPVRVLGMFLRALGVDPSRVPADPDEAAALFRSRVAGRRMLLVLDNAASAEQVRPLLPGGRSVVLVTSRQILAGLSARDGARQFRLDVLTPPDALTLLETVLGADRMSGEPDAAAELARLCAYLPLALRIVAARTEQWFTHVELRGPLTTRDSCRQRPYLVLLASLPPAPKRPLSAPAED